MTIIIFEYHNTLLNAGIGYQISIPVMLKNVWQRAICNDAWKVLAGPDKAARIPVTVVPFIK